MMEIIDGHRLGWKEFADLWLGQRRGGAEVEARTMRKEAVVC